MAFSLAGWSVSDPIDGKRQFSARLTAVDFNTGTVYDNAVTTKASPLLEVLREHGENLLIKQVTASYEGAAAGRVIQPTIYTSDDGLAFLESQITVLNSDTCSWPGLHIPVRFKEIYHYLFRVLVTNYAATDDMTVTIHGEVF